MIRFILRRSTFDGSSGLRREDLQTLDIDVPELESLLLRGGYGPAGYDSTELVGAEVREERPHA